VLPQPARQATAKPNTTTLLHAMVRDDASEPIDELFHLTPHYPSGKVWRGTFRTLHQRSGTGLFSFHCTVIGRSPFQLRNSHSPQ